MDAVTKARERGLVILRVVLGFGFLYAGLEKWLNFAGDEKPWSAAGFLTYGTAGSVPNMVGLADPMSHNPTQSFWVDLASNPTVIGIVDSWWCSARSRSEPRSSWASRPAWPGRSAR